MNKNKARANAFYFIPPALLPLSEDARRESIAKLLKKSDNSLLFIRFYQTVQKKINFSNPKRQEGN
ncbi:MAG: hypothetical protein K2H60_17130 [Muribaculaceae bacterium]|nr:hypothetical protein [Muribaculaceae bacterium]